MVIYDHNSKILKHVVRKCHINSTYPSTAHMLSCVQLDILQSGVQQHEEGGGQQKRIYNNERNENEESQIAQKLPICVSRGCLKLAITIFPPSQRYMFSNFLISKCCMVHDQRKADPTICYL